jgi:protein-tyrosine phosphatase
MQLTGRALIGEQGATMQNLAELLLTNHMIHLIASDGHDATARRSPQLSTARRRAAELIGKEAAASLVMHHPAALISGKALHIAQPQSVRKRQRWFWQHL